ncbi:glycosyltransferase [Anianabacter salinae]|uniref:glycosyltransferase n=1 Tax=Anianabacter salinae TaxID=2851023 RepID=UPI00225DDD17|nr:glycosyltransferase [Anianabacter salinae]MBV0913476.1 glycosyltransferase [Anianabacter salinae]
MRIAMIIPSLGPVGGVETLFISLAGQFIQSGHEVDFVLRQEVGPRPQSVPPGVRVIVFGVERLRDMVFPLRAYFRDERPDAVLVAMWPLTSIVVLAHRLVRSKARLVLSDHNTLSQQYRHKSRLGAALMGWSIRLTYPLADVRVAVSRGVAADLARLSGLRAAAFKVIHNALSMDMRAATPDEIETAWSGYTGRRILTVGRFKPQKNHPLLVKAFAKARQARAARLVILGTGESEDDTRQAIAAAGLDDDILMPGFADDPAPYYQGADLFVLSSDYEGFGNVIVEALAEGVPVVSTDCPSGPAEILEDGRFGTLVPVGDAEALARAMIEALDAVHDTDALRVRGRSFTVDAAARAYLRLMSPDTRGAHGPHAPGETP